MSQKGKLNTEEKVEIIKKYRQGEISLVQAARDAGVGTTTIYRWSARYETDVYLPGGASWTNAWTGETFEGGQKVHVAAPIEQIPLFTRDGYKLPMK